MMAKAIVISAPINNLTHLDMEHLLFHCLVELFLPPSLSLCCFANEWQKGCDTQKPLVHPVPRLLQGSGEIHEQYHAISVSVVPHFVIERVVEDEHIAFR